MGFRVAIVGFAMESNSFSPIKVDWSHFQRNGYILRGPEIYQLRKTNTEIAGFLQTCETEGVELVPLLAVWAVSSGIVREKVIQSFLQELGNLLRQARIDGMLIMLHGAMVSEQTEDVEGHVLEVVRNVLGRDVPIVCTLDLHACVTERMVNNCDGIVSYRTFPHVDFFSTGKRAAQLLLKLLYTGCKTFVLLEKIPMIAPSENAGTGEGPVGYVIKKAVEAEGESGIESVGVFTTQPWLDVRENGFSVTATVLRGFEKSGKKITRRLARLLWDARYKLWDLSFLVDPAQAIDLALSTPGNPIVISEPSDNVGAGATGDSPVMLAHFLAARVHQKCKTICTILDAPAVMEAWKYRVGEKIVLAVGGSIARNLYKPVTIEGILWKKNSSGQYKFTGPVMTGLKVDIGKSVVIRIGTLFLQITERPAYTVDPGHYYLAGLDPRDAKIVLVKSQGTFKGFYAPIAKRIIYVDTPGISSPRLTQLPFRRLPRTFFPFDHEVTFPSEVSRHDA